MINNPYQERYLELQRTYHPGADPFPYAGLNIDLYYALDEALGKIYELEQALEGRDEPYPNVGAFPLLEGGS